MNHLPVGKLPPALLNQMLSLMPSTDARVKVGPGTGLDCAVLEMGDHYLVVTSDPITLVSDDIGSHVVQICANDLVTTGAVPLWFVPTVLLPENSSTKEMVLLLSRQMQKACQNLGVSIIGGHTEVTMGLDRPMISGTMLGEVAHDRLVTPRGLEQGDHILLTKEIPIEGLGILGKELPDSYRGQLTTEELHQAAAYLTHPGISVVPEARLACQTAKIHAMHDPTEGGLASALWELAEASRQSLIIRFDAIPIASLAVKFAQTLFFDPLAMIASGALLIGVSTADVERVQRAIQQSGIACTDIGQVEGSGSQVWLERNGTRELLHRPQRDELARILEQSR